nr:chemotaxis protein CheB [uncultured Sphaerochaeta sp.]
MKQTHVSKHMEQIAPKYFVGIGASAGGLEALQEFFKNLPDDIDASYIVIQHLAPDYKSMMDELLSRFTDLPIEKIKNGQTIVPRTIYLIPPAHNLTIYHGQLYLDKQTSERGFNLPVDIFFRSLATDQEKQAIAVVLSGTGSDGTMGVKAIKEMGGMVLAQATESAKFDGMPRNTIDTGLVDYILPPAKMGEAIQAYINHPLSFPNPSSTDSITAMNIDAMAKILLILRETSGIDFSFYKENTIARRIERRVSIKHYNTINEYLSFLVESDEEKEILYKELLIGVTRFFRDGDAFAALREKVLPQILKEGASVRIWSTGCSTGEEVYSLAIECLEYIKEQSINCELKIFATDIDKHALEFASAGYYPSNIASDIDSSLLSKYFISQHNGYLISEDVRRLVVFAVHNVLKDPPFSRIDLICCRNLFIYFKSDIQQQVLSMFFYSLVRDGYLFMGSSESIGEMSEAFKSVDLKWKLYRKEPSFNPKLVGSVMSLEPSVMDISANRTAPHVLVKGRVFERLLENTLSAVLPPSVIVDENDNIVHIVNNMNSFMEIRPGRFSQNLLSNLPTDLSLFVNNILRRLKDGDREVAFENITGIQRFIDKRVSIVGRVIKLENRRFYQLSFETKEEIAYDGDAESTSVEIEHQVGKRIVELENSLQLTKENLQATVEELETSNEELQSSNEELIASNEELQSTNEELQAVNEELYSVNAEYQQKIDELIKTTNDLDNLIKNSEIGALYLDRDLCIRRFTPSIHNVANIIPSDIGRPIAHVSFKNNSKELMQDIQRVIETLQHIEREIEDTEGQYWLVRIRPYRTSFNAVDGIIMIFVDITKFKDQEKKTQLTLERMEAGMRIGEMAWWLWDIPKNAFIYDTMLIEMLLLKNRDQPYDFESFLELVHPSDRTRLSEAFTDLRHSRRKSLEMTIRIRRSDGVYLSFSCNAGTKEEQGQRSPTNLFGTLTNISKILKLESALMDSTENFDSLAAWNPQPHVLVDQQGAVQFISEDAAKFWNRSSQHFLEKQFDSFFILDSEKADIGPFALLQKEKKPCVGAFPILPHADHAPVLIRVQGFLSGSHSKQNGNLFIIHGYED